MSDRLRVLELYCGIGGCAAALGDSVDVVAAVDINRSALAAYSHNFPHPVFAGEIESITREQFRRWDADLWWMSPPCQPYSRRGKQRDIDDPRSASLLAMIKKVRELRPAFVALENVPPFRESGAHRRLREVLDDCDYSVRERILCPSELGVPNRRRRFYLVAGQKKLSSWPRANRCEFRVADIIDRHERPELNVQPELLAKYKGAAHVVDPSDPASVTSCFTSAYGRSPIRSGSYLKTNDGVRRFSPEEILHLLCFPASFTLPKHLNPSQAWPLVGNSLSIRAVQSVLAIIPQCAQSIFATTSVRSSEAGAAAVKSSTD